MKLVGGIDPGKKGAIVLLGHDGRVIHSLVMPEKIIGVIEFFEDRKDAGDDVTVWIEKAQPMPQNGVSSMFNYGRHFGELLGAMEALRIVACQISPSVWTRSIHSQVDANLDPKAKSAKMFKALFPDFDAVQPRCRVPHEGIIDAALIAEYGRRTLEQWFAMPF